MCQARSIIDSPVASTTLAAAGITPSSSSIEIYSVDTDKVEQERARLNSVIFGIRGGISLIPAGYNPLGKMIAYIRRYTSHHASKSCSRC